MDRYVASRDHTPRMTPRAGVAIFTILGFAATFLPWFSMPMFGTVFGIHGEAGWVNAALFCVAFAAVIWKPSPGGLEAWEVAAIIAAAGLASYFAIHKLYTLNQGFDSTIKAGGQWAAAMVRSVTIGPGLYVVAFAGIAACVVAIAGLFWRE